jgi:Ca2+-binding RTX toxin-like protein
MLGYGVVLAPPAVATPAETAAATAIRDAIVGATGVAPFLDGLTAVGAFAVAEPALTLVPNEADALGATPLADALAAMPDVASADSPAALATALTKASVTLDAGANPRTADFTSSVSTVNGADVLHVDVRITRAGVTTGIRLHSTSKPIDFSSQKGVTAQPTLHVVFDINRDDVNGARLVANPVVSLDTTASLSGTLADVDASLGILGVTLGKPPVGTSDNKWDVTTHISGAVRDPNNDGFLTLGSTGEAGAAGASAGLGTVSVANPGGGTLDGHLYITPSTSTAITNLPGANIDVTATSANLATDPTADYADNALAPVAAFQRLSPFDLAQGVAQLAVTLDTIEHARPTNSVINVDLPLARGSLADLVPANEALEQFLQDHVTKGAVLGQPSKVDFKSVQTFLEQLAATKGPGDPYTVSITGADFVATDAAHPRLVFTVNVLRAPSDQPTDPLAKLLTAGPTGVVYADDKITTSVDFGSKPPSQDQAAADYRNSLRGRQINAGTHSAVIDHVLGSTIFLDPAPLGIPATASSFWKGGTPTGGSYSIEAGDAKTGNVELNNALKATGHLTGANSGFPQATTTAGYDVTLPLVLDLEPAVTGAACITATGGTGVACPYQVTHTDGSATVIQELPARPDRIMLGTGAGISLLTARATMTSPVDITAPVGFAPVRIGGTLELSAPDSAINMSVTTAALGDISLGTLINRLQSKSDATVLNATVTGLPPGTTVLNAHAGLTLDVVRAPTFFADPAALGTASIDASAPSTTAPVVTDTNGDLAALAVLDVAPATATDPGKPAKLFDLLLADLGALNTTLTTAPTAGHLGTPVPVLGTTLGQAMAGQESRGGAKYKLTGNVLTLTDTIVDPVTGEARTFDAARSIGRRVIIGGTVYVANGLHIVTPAKPATDTVPAQPAVLDAHALDLQAPTGDSATAPADGTPYALIDDFSYAIDAMTAAPPTNLDDMIGGMEQVLGADSHITFTVDRGATPALRLRVVWPHTYDTTNTLLQTLSLNGGDVPLSGHTATGEVPIHVVSTTDATLAIPLTGAGVDDPAKHVSIAPTSSRVVHVTSSVSGELKAAAGSFELALGADSAIKADVTATAAGTGSADVDLDAWTTGLSDTLTGVDQTCGSVTGAVCASLPIAAAATPATSLGTLTVTVPAASLTPTVGDITTVDALAAALKGSVLDLGPLSSGLMDYFDTTKEGLDAAVAGGKVPLVGKDLQMGTDFLGKLKAAFAAAMPEGSDYATAGGIQKALQGVFDNKAITDLGVLQGSPTVSVLCDAVLAQPKAPTIVATGASSTAANNTNYYYAVVPYVGTTPGPLSPASAAASNLKTADGTAKNAVSWTKVTYAKKYNVYRSATGAAGSWHLLQPDITGLTVDDKLADVTAGAAPATTTTTKAPSLGNQQCEDDAPPTSVTAISLAVKLGQGNINKDTGECTKVDDTHLCLSAGLPLDLGLPGISLHARKAPDGSDVDGDKVKATFGWTLDLQVTLDKKRGFLVETTKAAGPELRVGASISLPKDATLSASVSFIKAQLSSNSKTVPELGLVFSVDLACKVKTTAACPNGALPITSLLTGGATLTPALTGSVNINEHFDTGVGAPGSEDRDPSLPGLSGDFHFLGTWASSAPTAFSINPTKGFGFYDVRLDAGQFLQSAVGPVVQNIINTLKPVQPILDTVSAPIPVLSDLSKLAGGDDVTLVSLAAAFGSGSATVAKVLAVIKTIKEINAVLTSVADGDGFLIGSLDLSPVAATTTAATATNSKSLIASTTDSDGGTTFPSKMGAINDKMKKTSATAPTLSDADPSPATTGFTFPVLKHPEKLLKLLVGEDVELAHFDSGPVGFQFTFSQAFGPVYAPPPVLLTISGSAGVEFRIAAGFDTYGIRQAVERGKLDVHVLDSLYFVTKDDNGQLIPVVHFTGEIAAGAEVSVAFLSVGVEGGIRLTVDFTWNDPNNDGKFRFSEFLGAVMHNPICLFNVGGRLSLFLKIFVTIGFSPFDVSFDFTLADITLLDFSLKPDCTPPPPKLGGVKDGVLYLFAGAKNGTDDQRGKPWGIKADDAETWIVRQSGTTVTVQALGLTEDFTGITTVVLDARTNTDKQRVIALFQGKEKSDSFTDTVYFYGGAGNDVVKTDVGPAFIDGGAGDDSITTGDRPLTSTETDKHLPALAGAAKVVVAGNGGNDHITVGNAVDTVAGDGHLSTTGGDVTVTRNTDGDATVTSVTPSGVTLENNSSVSDCTDASTDKTKCAAGNDTISVGLGGGDTYGGPGGDQIAVAQDSPLAGTISDLTIRKTYQDQGAHIYGGTGPDRISGGAGDDKIFTGADPGVDLNNPDASQDGTGTDDALGANEFNTVDTGTGNDVVVGSNGVDLVTGHSRTNETDVILGMDGNDVLTGGDGTDRIFGGRGDDYLVAQPADVTLQGADATDQLGTPAHPVSVKPDSNAPSSKTLVGGGGSDRIYGGDGASTIFGDHMAVSCAQAGSNRSDGPDEDTSGYTGANADGADLIFGGAGIDTIQAGGGADWVFAKGGNDIVCGMRGDDHLYGGTGNDTIWGGGDNDVVQGDDGNDMLYGNEGDDALYGNQGNDTLEGNADTDVLFGGQDADVEIGGTSAAGRLDAGDYLYGDQGTDVLIGDNGDPASSAGPSFDLADSAPVDPKLAHGGNDVIAGGDDNDNAYGGLGNDTITGNLGQDHLEGGPGVDTITGNGGSDDIVGGSSQVRVPAAAGVSGGSPIIGGFPDTGDFLFGDDAAATVAQGAAGDDVILGDNGSIADTTSVDLGDVVGRNRDMTVGRVVMAYDLGEAPAAGTSGGDVINAGDTSDVVYGQGGDDTIHGNGGSDYLEGGSGVDRVSGDAGEDDIVGGSRFPESATGAATVGQPDAADVLDGGSESDVVLGDNGTIDRVGTPSAITQNRGMTARTIALYDLGDSASATHSGGDLILGGVAADVLMGQGGDDVVQGGAGDDYAEGGGGTDRIEGNAGDDDLVGGSSTALAGTGDATSGQLDGADLILGGTGDDVALGDNGVITRVGTLDPRTFRIGSTSRIMTRRSVTAYDLRNGGSLLTLPNRAVFGADQISGGAGVDLILGQDGNDVLTGEAGDDYIEGNGGNDVVYGDTLLPGALPPGTPLLASDSWQTRVAEDLGETDVTNGQDDMIGGSSTAGFRDAPVAGTANDAMHGDGGADYMLGDNGQIVRDILEKSKAPVTEATQLTDASYPLTNRVYAKRYPSTPPPDAAYVRHGVSATTPTRFCTVAQATCEAAGAFGNDTMYGDAGDDTVYGQDGNDTISGGDGDDDLYGELGDDVIDGGTGNDAIVGDRGGIVDEYQTGANLVTLDYSQVPQIHYVGYQAGSVTRRVDLLHDVNGDVFMGTSASAPMPHRGDLEGGNDQVRGRLGKDSIHGGAGDDLLNGDSGGDIVYGDDGNDVIWGGKGSDSQSSLGDRGTVATSGFVDGYVDYVFGGKGADILDWRPRGTYSATTPGPTTCSPTSSPLDTTAGKTTTTVDPCSWFLMTDIVGPDLTSDQHHQGVDWLYGGWDRDVLQGDVADNGPNQGDRLLDWNGAYNLYTHCNASYGGYNDVRQHSPAMQSFLQQFATTTGAGQAAADVTTSGTSAFDELALAYTSDTAHSTGSAFPTTPGHFDNPNACAP